MADERKRVWVLGAGFSRSLGGPLLGNLLSDASYDHIRRVYTDVKPFVEEAELMQWVYRIYQFGTRYQWGCILPREKAAATGGQDIWRDAEVFLDELDTAGGLPGSTIGKKIAAVVERLAPDVPGTAPKRPHPSELAVMARRIVAAECSAFLKDPDVSKTERWEPYRDWGDSLTGNDTIVTFNYDLVVETVTESTAIVILNEENAAKAKRQGICPILKMHGSVDWCRTETEGLKRWKGLTEFALGAHHSEMCVATPGPTKASTAEYLAPIWDAATAAVRNADEIYFVGYRFPPTDAESRKRLLTAIHQNERTNVALEVILGPRSQDADRLSSLLRYASFQGKQNYGGRDPVVRELGAEDFFTARRFV